MGEIAEMMLEGILDEQTGEYIGKSVGYPRTREKGFYNSMKKKKQPKRNIRHALKGESVGGLHLVGKSVLTEKYGKCHIIDYVGKRNKRRYVLVDEKGEKHKVKFNVLIFNK